MTCIIFGDAFTFPDGDASTNRVYTYARGFLEHGLMFTLSVSGILICRSLQERKRVSAITIPLTALKEAVLSSSGEYTLQVNLPGHVNC